MLCVSKKRARLKSERDDEQLCVVGIKKILKHNSINGSESKQAMSGSAILEMLMLKKVAGVSKSNHTTRVALKVATMFKIHCSPILYSISLGSISDTTIKLKTPIPKKWRMYDIC